jgi:hypothetical protein
MKFRYILPLLFFCCRCSPSSTPLTSAAEVRLNNSPGIRDTLHLNPDITLISLTQGDSVSYIFVHQKKWQLLDSNTTPVYYKTADMNGDRLPDLVGYDVADIHGMRSTLIYLQQADSFIKARIPGRLCNAQYDSNTRIMKSYYISGAFGVHVKGEYRWDHDTLLLIRRVEMNLSSLDSATIRWYERKNDTPVLIKQQLLADAPDFDSIFWPYYDESLLNFDSTYLTGKSLY